MLKKATLILGLVTLCSGTAYADTIVGAKGAPGVATSWKAGGGGTVLQIKDGYSASEVAEAIQKSVPGAKASAGDDSVTVTGVSQADLLKALERIEVAEELDDIDAAFAAVQGGGDDEDSGSSIRATKAATIPGVSSMITGRIVAVQHKRFPLVALTIKVQDAGTVAGLSKGKTIKVVPRVSSKRGIIAKGDKQSQQNVSSWYARKGDRVKVGLGKKMKRYWVADTFERVK